MIPDKIRRKKRSFGVLKRILLIRARRNGRVCGSSGMDIDIDHRALWRMRMAAPGKSVRLTSMEDEIPPTDDGSDGTIADSEPEKP